MCGILLIKDNRLDVNTARQALETLDHRGPDNTGTIIKDNLFIGHKRLSIIDLSISGNQPMISKCGRFVIIFPRSA